MATTGRGVGNYELDIIHSPALECPFAVMSNDIGLPLFFCTELMPLYRQKSFLAGEGGTEFRQECRELLSGAAAREL